MKNYIITLDTGTTNSRAILWNENREQIGTEKTEVGVRNTAIDGNNNRLKEAVKGCLDGLVNNNNISYDDVKLVIASGMITSNVGLVEIPHLVAPVSLEDLAEGTKPVELPDVCPLPIWFVPGVKNFGTDVTVDNFESMDIMRGEEVESIGILSNYSSDSPIVLVLPGSHTKFVAVDEEQRIAGCLTSIAGEMLSSITNHTIISDAVGRKFTEEDSYDKEMMLLGYQTAERVGLTRACFSARILNQFAIDDTDKIANYILGATLQCDIQAIKNSSSIQAGEETTMIVSGKNPLRQALVDILEHDGSFAAVEEFVNKQELPLSAMGAYLVAEKCDIL